MRPITKPGEINPGPIKKPIFVYKVHINSADVMTNCSYNEAIVAVIR
jgi:hypothetical protein